MNGFYDYLTISKDGDIKATSSDLDIEFSPSITVIRFSLIDYGQDVRHEKLTREGWIEIKEVDNA